MKALKPSHREKKRYLLISGKNSNQKNIDEAILRYIGILGYSEASPKVIKKVKNKLILSINRKSLDKIRASLLLYGKDINIDNVSGVINKVK